ncbi:hypothetical protein [Erythrobacter sp. THAF29]|nr:hypothetical protein [Erythrobacter sp. THAF29]QFT77681.1 hypothetical protein FIU90_09040 [Erythrobacter sp. THAF29]
MHKNKEKPLCPREAWDEPRLHTLDFDVSAVATARNPGSDAGNGRTSSGS